MVNNTLTSTVSPEQSDLEKALYGYTGIQKSLLVYYKIEVAIYVITIFTNSITVTLLSCYRRMRILSNLFFACLAVTEFVQGFFGVTFNVLRIYWFTGDLSCVKAEGVMFLLVGWWLSTLFGYCSVMLITLERWLFIAHPFVHQRFYTAKFMFGVVGFAMGLCVIGSGIFSTGDARSANVGISFPLLHTIFSLLIVCTYAHIILISYRQQRSIRAQTVRPADLSATSHRDRVNKIGIGEKHIMGSLSSNIASKGVSTSKPQDKSNASDISVFIIGLSKHSGDDSRCATNFKNNNSNSDNNNTLHAAATEPADTLTPSTVSVTQQGDSSVGGLLNTQRTNLGVKNAEKDRARSFSSSAKENKIKSKCKSKSKSKNTVAHNWKAVRISATVFCMYFCFMSPWIYYEAVASFIYGPRRATSEISQALNTLTCLHFCSNFFVYSFQNCDFRRVLGKFGAKVFGYCFPRLRNRVDNISHVTSGHY